MRSDLNWDHINTIVNKKLYEGSSSKLQKIVHLNLSKFGNVYAKKTLNPKQLRILEIGAGKGEHYDFVDHEYSEYLMTDISDWGRKEISQISLKNKKVRFEIQDVESLTYEDNYFNRVIVTCVLNHVDEPFAAIAEIHRVLQNRGVASVFISAEPGILLRLIRKIFVQSKMKDLGVSYNLMNAISHRNSAQTIIEISKEIFKSDIMSITYYPFHIPSWNLSTHLVLNVVKNS